MVASNLLAYSVMDSLSSGPGQRKYAVFVTKTLEKAFFHIITKKVGLIKKIGHLDIDRQIPKVLHPSYKHGIFVAFQ